jgi:hypothetical protein
MRADRMGGADGSDRLVRDVEGGLGGAAQQPVRQMLMEDNGAGARTLAETVVRARCRAYGSRPTRVCLAEDGRGPGPITGGPAEPGWSILLHEEPGEPI